MNGEPMTPQTPDREVDSKGNCSKCGGTHYGSYYCPFPSSETTTMPETDIESLKRFVEARDSGVAVELPRYKCHKEVWALKIANVIDPTLPGNESDGSRVLVPVEQGYAPFRVDHDYVRKHKPEAGGYYVQYQDGYKSFSPARAFEEGYSRV